MEHKQVIYGQPPSKANTYRIITMKGSNGKHHGSLAKTDALRKYEHDFYLQCGFYRNKNIQGFFELYVDVYFHSNQPDLDNSLKCLLDCLQSCKAIKNDRNCVKIIANKFVDKNNPRIEFTIIEVGNVETRNSRLPELFDEQD